MYFKKKKKSLTWDGSHTYYTKSHLHHTLLLSLNLVHHIRTWHGPFPRPCCLTHTSPTWQALLMLLQNWANQTRRPLFLFFNREIEWRAHSTEYRRFPAVEPPRTHWALPFARNAPLSAGACAVDRLSTNASFLRPRGPRRWRNTLST